MKDKLTKGQCCQCEHMRETRLDIFGPGEGSHLEGQCKILNKIVIGSYSCAFFEKIMSDEEYEKFLESQK